MTGVCLQTAWCTSRKVEVVLGETCSGRELHRREVLGPKGGGGREEGCSYIWSFNSVLVRSFDSVLVGF